MPGHTLKGLACVGIAFFCMCVGSVHGCLYPHIACIEARELHQAISSATLHLIFKIEGLTEPEV